MDPTQFDRLTKSLTAAATRRGALAGMLGGALAAVLPLAGDARRKKNKNKKQKRKRRNRRRNQGKTTQPANVEPVCFTGSPCIVEEAARLDGCDLGGSTALRDANCTACSLEGANLFRADLARAKLGAASFDGACLIEADLFEADLDGASFDGAIFCGTIMPDGSINDSGCNRTTECCNVSPPGGPPPGSGGPGCEEDSDCLPDEFCPNGSCVPRPPGSGGPSCQQDSDCLEDEICLDGVCGIPCGGRRFCLEPRTCCSNNCTDTERDRANCGACGNACAANQICLRGDCVNCDVCRSGCTFNRVQNAVDAAGNGDTVALCPGTYREHVRISRNLTLVGQGHEPFEVELDGQDQLFPRAVLTVDAGAQVVVRNLTITGGNTNGDGGVDVGGGVGNHGDLRLEQVEVVDNHATNFDGGGIANLGPNAVLVVDRSPVRRNTARNGGGISNDRGTVTVISSRIGENTASGGGGGVSNDRGNVTLRDSTLLILNTALAGGGLNNNRGTSTLLSSAILRNTAQQRDGTGGIGGGINNFGSPGNRADAHVFIEDESDVTENIATAGPGSGGGIFNAGRVTVQPRSTVFGNTPDNCVNDSDGEGCPA